MDEFKEKFLSPFLPNSFAWEEEEHHEDVSFFGNEITDLPLLDEQDKEIFMHRDVHFSGSFSMMLEYYLREDAKGKQEDIDPERIQFLERLEHLCKKNLAPMLLSGSDAERVAKMRKLHETLQNVVKNKPASAEGILASSILSEEKIEKIVENIPQMLLDKPEILLPLVSSEEFADSLSPGYGLAPLLAIELLGKAKYPGAIKELFLCIGRTEENTESAALSALTKIGDPAKQFGIKILKARPITIDSERAALLLIHFLPDTEIETLFLEQLKDQNVQGMLREYLSSALSQ